MSFTQTDPPIVPTIVRKEDALQDPKIGNVPQIRTSFASAVGNTPLIFLRGPSEATGCKIYGKAEFMNPGGSVKDRAALGIIENAEKDGLLRPGGLIVEGTAGNTGIGLTLVGNSKGYRSVIVIPDTQSQEKKDMLRNCGAQLIEVPAKPYADANNYIKVSDRLATELNKLHPQGAIWANQFDNVVNRETHERTTGPEIWAQTEGHVDGFCCAIGTGGTLSGVGRYLKRKNPSVVIAAADPMGAKMYHWIKHGELKSEGDSITEGIGQARITQQLVDHPIDDAFQIPDEEALPWVYSLLMDEGLCVGGSTGVNVAGAVRLAKQLGPGHTIITILCDSGARYASKLFNPAFLTQKNLEFPSFLKQAEGDRWFGLDASQRDSNVGKALDAAYAKS